MTARRSQWLWLALPILGVGGWWVAAGSTENTAEPKAGDTAGSQRELVGENQAAMERAARGSTKRRAEGATGPDAYTAKQDRKLLGSDPAALRGLADVDGTSSPETAARQQARAARARTLNARTDAPLRKLRALRDAMPAGPRRDRMDADLAQIERNIELRRRFERAGDPPERAPVTSAP